MAKDTPVPDDLTAQVLAFVSRKNYQPVKPRVIAKKLGLPRERHAELKRVVKQLARQGKLAYGEKHLVKPAAVTPRTDKQTVVGIFRRASGGYGFVKPRNQSREGIPMEDIYVAAHKTGDASDGDLVAVHLKQHRRSGEVRQRGEIVQVIERETHQFVGTYSEHAGYGLATVDGNVFAQPIAVGDPGAKSAAPGDKVVVEMVRFPSPAHDGEAVIVEVLGPRGTPGVDTLTVMREFQLPEEFPEDVLECSRRVADAFEETVAENRTDFTALTVITIDPKDARDFDDAISLELQKNGHWKLGVHIADVSHFVPENSPLDREARNRATSVYLPDRVIPMLPEVISNNLASLQPERLRFTMSAFIEFTPDGAVVATETFEGAICSKRRFTYEEVDKFLDDRAGWRKKLAPEVFELLDRMHQLAMILRRRRLEGGSIELTLPEVKIELNKKGEVKGAHLVEHTESHQIIEEFMLAANEAVARLFHDKDLHALRRIHESPDPRKLKALTEFVRELGIPCESLESRFEIKRVVAEVAGLPTEFAVNFAILRSMQKAVYSPDPEGHYALHSDHYCHFTSPIRRYPDLIVHRALRALHAGTRPKGDIDQLALLGEHCSQREQRAERAERQLTKLKLLGLMSKRIGSPMEAVITGVERFGLFAQGLELPAEGFIHIDSLQDDVYQFEPRSRSLTGRRAGNAFRLGDLVRVEVAHVDLDRRQMGFRLISRKPSAARTPTRKSKRKKASRTTTQKSSQRTTAKKKRAKSAAKTKRPRKKRSS